MTFRLFMLLAILTAFTVFTGIVIDSHGLAPIPALLTNADWSAQVFIDLIIALGLFIVWMVGDARQHGINPWLYGPLTVFTGSIGALTYLVHRTILTMRRTGSGSA